jgi:CheY-like chemotaxis protein
VAQGSIFRIYLPAAEPPRLEGAPETALEPAVGGNETILVVEDEAAVRLFAARTLERHGYRVLQATHGQEALRFCGTSQRKVDLLLTDVVMPEGLGGFELAERLRKIQPDLQVMLMSGYSAELMSRGFKVLRGTTFLQKPFAPRDLLKGVRQLLDARTHQGEGESTVNLLSCRWSKSAGGCRRPHRPSDDLATLVPWLAGSHARLGSAPELR